MSAISLLYQLGKEYPAQRIGIIHAQDRPELSALLEAADDYQLQQHFRDESLKLQQSGYPTLSHLEGLFDLILIHPSKSRQQTLGWVAEALTHCRENGQIMLCAANRHGSRGMESQLRKITDQLTSVAKSKCRCLSFAVASVHNSGLVHQWQHDAMPQLVAELGIYSQPGLFSWSHPDPGSLLLLQHLPNNLNGSGMDLCCGNGFLACNIVQKSPHITHLHLVDHDRLALACAKKNLSTSPLPYSTHWLDATREPLPNPDWIVCNPPFHQHQQHSIELGQTIITRACQNLKRGARIWIVANRKLPYETVLTSQLGQVDIITQQQGYKIIYGIKK